jgi:aromatic ring hydroxylase
MGLRTGKEFIAGLNDGRHVYANGELIRDVTKSPGFAGVIRELADLYDLQHNPQIGPEITYRPPGGERAISCSLLMARDWPEMERRVRGERIRADAVNGMMGRLPDFVNAFVTDFAAAQSLFGRNDPAFGRNIAAYYELCCERDLCLTHALVDPQIDRTRGVEAQEALRIVGENSAGLIVSGARMLATLAPVADEILIAPFASRKPGEEEYAIVFAIPVAAEGLKLVCRETYNRGYSDYDRPLTTRYDEGDALAVFDNVLVPWERIFAARDIETYNLIRVVVPGYLWLNSTIRATAKLSFMTGLAALVAETVGRTELPRYQEILGELVANVELAEGLVIAGAHQLLENIQTINKPQDGSASGQGAKRIGGSHGTLNRGLVSLTAARMFFPAAHQKAVESIRYLGSSGLVITPSERDFDNPELQETLARHFKGHGVAGRDRVRVMKLAWDAISGDFGGRQLLYEFFYAGDPFNNRLLYFGSRRYRECLDRARRALDSSLAIGRT